MYKKLRISDKVVPMGWFSLWLPTISAGKISEPNQYVRLYMMGMVDSNIFETKLSSLVMPFLPITFSDSMSTYRICRAMTTSDGMPK